MISKKLLLVICFCITSVTLFAQDFATRFMQNHQNDNNLKCVTVSPKMMEKVMNVDVNDDSMKKMLADLKSMQMISSTNYVRKYYREAISLAKKNADRFILYTSYSKKKNAYEIRVRERKNIIVELMMVMRDAKSFSVINFTGKMDKAFIERLKTSVNVTN